MKRCTLLGPKSEQAIICSGCNGWLMPHSWNSKFLLTIREAREIAQEETND